MTRHFAIAASLVAAVFLGYQLFLVAKANNVFGAGDDLASVDQFAECRASTIAGGTDVIKRDFSLTDAEGKIVTDRDLITKPTLVYFGYTFCPDVCPFDTVRNADAMDILIDKGQPVQSIFISVDPDRDTPKLVKEYASNISEHMIGLTGTPEQVSNAAKSYRAYYKSNKEGDDPYYTVDHSTFTYLVLPEQGFVDFYRRELSPEDMATRVQCYLDKL